MSTVGELSLAEAVAAYEGLPAHLKAGTLNPQYVAADAKRDSDLIPTYWRYQEGNSVLLYSFHKAKIAETEWHDIQSQYGYGGALTNSKEKNFLNQADQAFSDWASKNNVIAEFVRFHPILKNWEYYQGRVLKDRETVYIDLAQNDLLGTYETRQRTAIKKAIKLGVTTEWLSLESLSKIFPDFYITAMQQLGAQNFYLFSPAYFEALFKLPFTQGLAAKVGGEIVAISLFLTDGVGEYHLSGKSMKGAQYSASNLLLHEACVEMKARGLQNLNLGGGTSAKPDDSLLFFKSGFSKLKADFMIGKRIFNETAYEHLKQIYAHAYQQNSNRVLFYRS